MECSAHAAGIVQEHRNLHSLQAQSASDDLDLEPRDWILLLEKQQSLFCNELFTSERTAVDWRSHVCSAECKFARIRSWMVCATSGSVHVCKSSQCNAEITGAFDIFCPLSGRTRQRFENHEDFADGDVQVTFAPIKDPSNGILCTEPTGMPGEREMIRQQRMSRDDERKLEKQIERKVLKHDTQLDIASNNSRVSQALTSQLISLEPSVANTDELRVQTQHVSSLAKLEPQRPNEMTFVAPPKARNRSRTVILKAEDCKEPARKIKSTYELTQMATQRARQLMPRDTGDEVLSEMARIVVDVWYSLQDLERFKAYSTRYTFAQHTLAALFGMQTGITRLLPKTGQLVTLLPRHEHAARHMMRLKTLIGINNLHKKRSVANPPPPFLPSRVTDATRVLKLMFKQKFEQLAA
jgi:hypothetical protein